MHLFFGNILQYGCHLREFLGRWFFFAVPAVSRAYYVNFDAIFMWLSYFHEY